MSNAKLAGSNIVDFIPQAGACPLGCPDCYYNLAVSEDAEWIAAARNLTRCGANGKIVRINSGHDSNLNRKHSVPCHEVYDHAFFNTSLPRFDFPRPVVFTANPGWMQWQFHEPATHWKWDNLMFVRFLVPDLMMPTNRIAEATAPYLEHDIFIALTFMRYTQEPKHKSNYDFTKHFEHEWWAPKLGLRKNFLSAMLLYKPALQERLGVCGGLDGDERCAACGICESTYWTWCGKHGLAKWRCG